MAGQHNKPAKRESQHPKKGAGSPGFSLRQNNGQVHFDPLATRVMMTAQSMSGPLPSSSEFAKYEEALPGAADRILAMAEKEQDHRLAENREKLALDRKLLNGHNWRKGFAQVAALILVCVAFYVSYDVIMRNHDKAGMVICGTTVAAILTAFLGAALTRPKKPKQSEEEG